MSTVDDLLEKHRLIRESCLHEDFDARVDVGRISAIDGGPIVYFSADLRIECRKCGQPMEFVGIPHGFSAYHPTVSIDEQKARLPMVIPGKMVPAGLPGFGVKAITSKDTETKRPC